MTGTDLASVFGVVIKIFFGQQPFVVTDEAILADQREIEIDLNLHVFGDGDERSLHLFDEHFAFFADAIDVGVVAGTFISQCFHRVILEIAGAVAEHAEEHTAARLLGDEFLQLLRATEATIEIAVGAEDDAIHAAFNDASHSLLIGQFDARTAMRAAAGLQTIDGGDDVAFFSPLVEASTTSVPPAYVTMAT